MDANERYEVKAEAFRMMTGQMAPGKDPPRGSYSEPFEDRMVMWDKWKQEHVTATEKETLSPEDNPARQSRGRGHFEKTVGA